MGCLYVIESPSGKAYVGITLRTASARFNSHCSEARSGSNRLLCRALRKYGRTSFTIRTLAISDSWEYLCFIEQRAISTLRTKAPSGYNSTLGGEGASGVVFSPERKKRTREVLKKVMSDPVVKLRHRLAKIHECRSEEGRKRLVEVANRPSVREKKSVSLKTFCKNNQEVVKARNVKIRETSATEESRKKRSLAGKAASSPDVCAKRSAFASQCKWMYKGECLSRVKLEKVDSLLSQGWRLGKPKLNKLL